MQKITITSNPDSLVVYLRKVIDQRHLIWVLASRDLQIKYAQTLFGLGWTVLNPLITLFVYTFFFTKIANISTLAQDYELHVFAGIISWNLFSYIVLQAGPSLQYQRDLIKKLNFPKLILLLSKVLVGLFDTFVSLVLLLLYLLISWHTIDVSILLLPVTVLANAVVGLCVAIWISNLSIFRRDATHWMTFLVRFGIWFTPVFYTVEMMPVQYRELIYFNPMTLITESYRFALLGAASPFNISGLSAVLTIIILGALGLYRFKNLDGKYAEFI